MSAVITGKTLLCYRDGPYRGNAAMVIIYILLYVDIIQCAINSIRMGVSARRRRMYIPYVCDTFDRSARSKLVRAVGRVDGHGRTVIVAVAERSRTKIDVLS